MSGSIFSGKYAVQEEIARGGMGVVYKAIHTALGRQVAIKVLHPQFSSDPAFLKRFEREARAMARLDHENVVRVFDVAQDGDSHYIVMEYFPGHDLKHLILDRENIPWQEMLKISIQVASALSYAHSQGIIHRDIKPGNIMVGKSGRAKIADFGIAAATDEVSVTATGQIIGTPEYMSPEQAMGEGVDARTDLYSLGMVMYELLNGVTTFQGISRMAIIGKLIYDKEEYNLSFPSDTPSFLQEVIRTLLMKAPASRFQDAAALVSRLNPSTSNTGPASIKTPSEETGPIPAPVASQDEGPTVMLEGGVSDETLARPESLEAKTELLQEAPALQPVSEEPQPAFSGTTPPPGGPSKRTFIPVMIGGAVILFAIIGALFMLRGFPVGKSGRAKIADFGIAAATDEVSVTATGQIIGTPEYMSPEQAMGEGVDARTDLYSLGMVMYELLNGVTTFQGISRMAIIGKLIYDKEEYNLSFPSDTPSFLQEVIRTLLMKAPASRFQDAAALVSRLNPSTSNTGPASIKTPSEETGPIPAPVASQDEGPTVMLEGGVSDETLARPESLEAKTELLQEAPALQPVSEEPQPAFSGTTPPPGGPSKRTFIPVMIGGAVILFAIIGALFMRSKPTSKPPLETQKITTTAPEIIEETPTRLTSLKDIRDVQLSIRDMQDKLKVLQKDAEDAGAPKRATEAFQLAMAEAMRGTGIVQEGAQWVNEREYNNARTTLESALVVLGKAEKGFVEAREAAIKNKPEQEKKPVPSPPKKKVVKSAKKGASVLPIVTPSPRKKPLAVKPKQPVAVKIPETKKTRPAPKKKNPKVTKNITPPPRNAPGPLDIQAVGVILEQFKRAYESQDLTTLGKMSKMSKGRVKFLEQLFIGYKSVEVSISDLSINSQSASAKITIQTLTDQRGNLVLPGKKWKTAKLNIPRDGNLWGKIVW